MRSSTLKKFTAKPNSKTEAAQKLRTILFSRLIFVVFLLLIQFAIYLFISLKLQRYEVYFLGTSVVISIVFLLYLVNTPGKNEFKLAWILPVLVVPIAAIIFYFMYKYNQGGIWLKRKLKKLREGSNEYLASENDEIKIADTCPEVKDIAYYLYKYGTAPCYKDNETKYFSCGEDFFEDLIDELSKAKRFIFFEFFIVEPCQIMDRLLEILSQKVKEGVEVRLLFDSIGSISFSSNLLRYYFTSYGISSKVWLKFIPVFNTGLNNRDHRKIISIDNKVAFTGGINITDEYANIVQKRFNYWKDAGLKIKGPAVRSFTLMFLEQWNVQNRKNVACENFERFVEKKAVLENSTKAKNKKTVSKNELVIPYGDDAYNGEEIAENVYKYILNKAQKKVRIMTPYVIIDNSLFDDIVFTVSRGVEVEIIVPAFYDHFISFCVGRTYIKNLIEKGVKVFAYEKGFVHSKVMTADEKFGTVGSVNLDYRSFYHHFECGAFLYNTDSVKAAEKDFDETKKYCTEITIENYKNTKWYIRAVGWLFRIVGPLL